jgi:hypothetical protein
MGECALPARPRLGRGGGCVIGGVGVRVGVGIRSGTGTGIGSALRRDPGSERRCIRPGLSELQTQPQKQLRRLIRGLLGA